MKRVWDYAWLPVLGLALVYFVWLRPGPRADPKAAIAALEAQRAEVEKSRAEHEARRADLDTQIAKLHTDHTLYRLRILGEGYRDHLTHDKKPPQAADLAYILGDLTSARDNGPFEVVWGVDPAKLPDGGAKMVLAWEKTPAADWSRCVLLADTRTAKVVTATEFEELPKAAPR